MHTAVKHSLGKEQEKLKKKERRSLKDTQDSILKYKRDEDTWGLINSVI